MSKPQPDLRAAFETTARKYEDVCDEYGPYFDHHRSTLVAQSWAFTFKVRESGKIRVKVKLSGHPAKWTVFGAAEAMELVFNVLRFSLD